jgi:hypothetical protein
LGAAPVARNSVTLPDDSGSMTLVDTCRIVDSAVVETAAMGQSPGSANETVARIPDIAPLQVRDSGY